MSRYQPLSPTAQTAYAQLLDAALAMEMSRSVGHLRGSFASKQVKGKQYWYFQYTAISGKVRQVYVGPDSEQVRALIQAQSQGAGPRATTVEALARSAVALGCATLLPVHLRVVQRLGEHGFFKAGGVLIGTHAFIAFGNMLGARWSDFDRTQDVDFAHAGQHLAIALPADIEVDTRAAIESLQMGLLPFLGRDGKASASWFDPRDPDFQLDFVTTSRRGGDAAYEHPQLGISLQPLKFMEYLLQDVQQAVVLSGAATAVVNVPHPARYAVHKLLVAGERTLSYAAKADKDIRQCADLLAWFRDHDPWPVQDAWQDLVERGKGWASRAARGRARLLRMAPELGEMLQAE